MRRVRADSDRRSSWQKLNRRVPPGLADSDSFDGGTLTTPLLPGCGIDVRALFRPTL
jgi:hypothetical protein